MSTRTTSKENVFPQGRQPSTFNEIRQDLVVIGINGGRRGEGPRRRDDHADRAAARHECHDIPIVAAADNAAAVAVMQVPNVHAKPAAAHLAHHATALLLLEYHRKCLGHLLKD